MSHTRLERLLDELRGHDDQTLVLDALTTALHAHRSVCGDDELEQEIGWLRIGISLADHDATRRALTDELERLLTEHIEIAESALRLPL